MSDFDDFEVLGFQRREKTTQEQTEERIQELRVDYMRDELKERQSKSDAKSRILNIQEMRHDKAALGSKTWWKPNDAEKRKNAEIDEAKALTQKATGYTLELYRVMQQKEKDGKLITLRRDADLTSLEQDVRTLSSLKFKASMLNASYIRKHFSELYDYVRMYENVNRAKHTNANTTEFWNTVQKFTPQMELLSRRVRQFAMDNRVSLVEDEDFHAHVLEDNEEFPAEDRITREEELEWNLMATRDKAVRRSQRLREMMIRPELEVEEMKALLQETKKERNNDEMVPLLLHTQVDELPDFFQMNNTQLVQNLPRISKILETMSWELSLEGSYTQEWKAHLKKEIVKLAALREFGIALLKDGTGQGNEKELRERAEEVLRIRKKMQTEALPSLVPEETLPAQYHKMTRIEATDNDSDNSSYEARTKLLYAAEKMFNDSVNSEALSPEEKEMVKSLTAAMRYYYEGNQYTVGHEEEEKRLKEVNRLWNLVQRGRVSSYAQLAVDPSYQQFSRLLTRLMKGGLEGPETETGHSVVVMDQFRNARPQDAGQFGVSVNIRDGVLHGLETWVDRTDDPLFAHEPTINDLRQGKISNCWMVAATTSVISMDPSIIKNCMKDNEDGTVTVRLYNRVQGKAQPVYITVKKETPRLISGGAILTDGPLWMSMLEKAAAFLGRQTESGQKSGYRSLWYGKGQDWIFALTGKTSEAVGGVNGINLGIDMAGHEMEESDTKKASVQEAVFNDILTAKSRGYVYSYGTKGSASAGMNSGHAYTVLGAEEIGGEKYIIMRNPYANMTLQYDESGKESMEGGYSDSVMNESCGQFRIKIADFLANMESLHRTNLWAPIDYAPQQQAPTEPLLPPTEEDDEDF